MAAGDSDLEVSDEDVAFVAQHSSRLAFLSQLSDKALHGCGPHKAVTASGARPVACPLACSASASSRAADSLLRGHREAKQGKKAAKRAAAAAAAAEAGLGDGAPGRSNPDPGRKGEEEEGEAYELAPRRQLRDAAEGRRAASLPVKVDGELVYGRAGSATSALQVSPAGVLVRGSHRSQIIASWCVGGHTALQTKRPRRCAAGKLCQQSGVWVFAVLEDELVCTRTQGAAAALLSVKNSTCAVGFVMMLCIICKHGA